MTVRVHQVLGDVEEVAGLTASRLAHLMGVTTRHLRRIKRGEHPLTILQIQAICDYLHIEGSLLSVVADMSDDSLQNCLTREIGFDRATDERPSELYDDLLLSIARQYGFSDDTTLDGRDTFRRDTLRMLIGVRTSAFRDAYRAS